MEIKIIIKEQLDKCGDEYLDEKDIFVTFNEQSKDYVCMEIEGRTFIIETNDIRKLVKIFGQKGGKTNMITNIDEAKTLFDKLITASSLWEQMKIVHEIDNTVQQDIINEILRQNY